MPAVLCYVGDPTRSLDAAQAIERRAERDLQIIAVAPDGMSGVLTDGRLDAVLCGNALDSDDIASVVDTVEATGCPVPVFDLTGSAVPVPADIDYHRLYPGTPPDEAADRILSGLDAGTDRVAAPTDDPDPLTLFAGMDAYIAVDVDGRVTASDPDLSERFGSDPAEAQGRPVAEVFPPADSSPYRAACERVRETGDAETVEFRHRGDWYRVRIVPGVGGGLRTFVRDVTDRKEDEAEISAVRERFENTVERITDAFFVLDNEEQFVLLNSRAETILDVDADAVAGERFWDVFPVASTSFYHEFTEALETQEPTSFEEYYAPYESWFEVNAYPSEDGLSVFLRDVTDQVELQRKLESLHETTQRLIVDTTDEDITTRAVQAAVEVLDFPLSVCWRLDETTRTLEPIATSEAVRERVDEIPPIEPGEGLAWNAYEEGDVRVIDSVAVVTPSSHYPGDVGSALLLPIGEYGLLGTYSEERGAFDETDVELFRILVTAVESALARARRERQLARRNERLDDFASTVSHDLRNPLHVAAARTELARETGDVEHLESVAESLNRMEQLIEDLLARARGERDIDRQDVSLANAARDAWEGLDTRAATLTVEGDATFGADPTRLTQLFENLYRNAIEHAGTDVTVRVGAHADGFYVADDGPGIPMGKRDVIFDQGVTGAEDGTGYGLAIVSDIAEGHDWTIEARESEDGGARFEISHVGSLSERRPA